MGLKICFYPLLMNKKEKEINILKYLKNTKTEGLCIYSIKAGEVCSEFIARYFYKPGIAPKEFLNSITKENLNKEETSQEIMKNIYKVKIQDMLQDNNSNFEFKTYKECKKVREKLLDKYKNIEKEIKENIEDVKLDIYALLALE